jgi:hypothetical protein
MKKEYHDQSRFSKNNFLVLFVLTMLAILITPSTSIADATEHQPDIVTNVSSADDHHYTFGEVLKESLVGDVYSDPSKWQELSYSDLFSKGWDKPWASPPNGSGGAPRQGWLNANDGVFYRLGIATFGWTHGTLGSGIGGIDDYSGTLTMFTPLNQRFEIQTDIPMVSTAHGIPGGGDTNFGDFLITPKIILSESKDVTQSFGITFRTPTGNNSNGNNVAAVNPNYQFWANPWKGLVVRGGTGFYIPYSNNTFGSSRSTYNANLAVGYYFTPHTFTPIGDMVWYLSANLSKTIDNRGPDQTFVSLTPGFRTHVGCNWYLLGAVEVPVTNSAVDYQVLGGIMKVF